MFRSKGQLSYGMRNKSSSLLTLNEIESLNKSSDWRKNYIIKPKEIGRGHFSKVYYVTCDNRGKSFAAKVIRRRKGGVDRLDKIRQEAALIRQLNNLGVHSVIQLFETYESFSEVVLISELAKGGSLYKLVQESDSGLKPEYVKVVTCKLLSALEVMHKENIVHLDIKADNILLREPYPSTDIALCDFGLATQLKEGKNHKELVGTPDYMAPEIINYEKVSVNADMWSVGVLVFYLLTGISPFMGKSKDETLFNVSKVKLSFDSIFSQPEYATAKDLISSLCIKSPELRLSSAVAQKHDWFVDMNGINQTLDISDTENDLGSDDEREGVLERNNNDIDIAQTNWLPRGRSVDFPSLNISSVFRSYRSCRLRPFSTASCENIFIETENQSCMNGFGENKSKLMNVEEVNDEVVNDIDMRCQRGNCVLNSVDLPDGIVVRSVQQQEEDDNRSLSTSTEEQPIRHHRYDEEEKKILEEEKKLMTEEMVKILEEEKKKTLEEEKKKILEEEKKKLMEEEMVKILEDEKKKTLEEEKKKILEEEKDKLLEAQKRKLFEEEMVKKLEEEKTKLLEEEMVKILEEENKKIMKEYKKEILEEDKIKILSELSNHLEIQESISLIIDNDSYPLNPCPELSSNDGITVDVFDRLSDNSCVCDHVSQVCDKQCSQCIEDNLSLDDSSSGDSTDNCDKDIPINDAWFSSKFSYFCNLC